MNLKFILEKAKEASVEAGLEIMKIYQGEYQIEYKEGDSPLTTADKNANDIILNILKKNFPDISILSEESQEDISRFNNEWCFVVDPLDGTKEFINKNGEFTVNIGLSKNGRVVLGVIYVPVTKDLYYAIQGEGSYLERKGEIKKLSVSDKTNNLILVGSKSHASDKLKALIEAKKEFIADSKSAGSSLKGLMIANGEADVYYRFGYTCEWDTCAMQIIVEEAGGIFKQMDKSDMTYNRKNTLNEKGFFIVNRKENIWV